VSIASSPSSPTAPITAGDPPRADTPPDARPA
jgi:hypothetical protein